MEGGRGMYEHLHGICEEEAAFSYISVYPEKTKRSCFL
jgi:hypothetical protein